MKDKEERRNWAELPSELTSLILGRLGAVDILENAQKVCTPWRRVCKDPSMWKKIDLRDLRNSGMGDLDFDILCRHAVDLSQGGLLEIHIENITTDRLLTYIADRSRNLRSLGLRMYYSSGVTKKGLVKAITKLPLLETLEVSHSLIKLDLKAIGYSCPQLRTLNLNSSGLSGLPYFVKRDDDDYALEIVESMPGLRHHQLLGNMLQENKDVTDGNTDGLKSDRRKTDQFLTKLFLSVPVGFSSVNYRRI
ncbi:hypothetical protein CARUB_v10003088mg [Capsella rubella]|uniref:F-box domain-containing protein n=2 Tax=Capsella rubella TaxID=81985 RepID=R0FJ56_9BRAS|nr:hypothetical protein CARUB_v10003088mg [Capsella rubella]